MNFMPPKCAPRVPTAHLKCVVDKKGCRVPKMKILSVLSDLKCFIRSWDAMQGVEV